MEIQRYLNGRPISRGELAELSLRTPELDGAVRDVRRRVRAEEEVSATMAIEPPVSADE